MEKLHIDVLNADNRARGNFFLHLNVVVISLKIFFHFSLILVLICVVLAPNQYCVGHANPDASYPPPVEGGGANVDGYGRTLVHMGVGSAGDWIIPYNSSNGEVSSVAFGGATTSNAAGATMSNTGGVVHWVGPFDPSLARG
jgi:hypothetical protein